MHVMEETAPAKLNLALDILRRRPDGYHDLRMVMQSVSLCDTITVWEADAGFWMEADGITLPKGKKTMEERAAEAFFAGIGCPMPGLRLHLEKRIPAYAGMGGGSADVAALLRALRKRYAPELSDAALEKIGLTVGSDVPFCIRGGTALAEGRGEQLTALPPLPDCRILICKPEFDLPTPDLFRRVRVEALKKHPDLDAMAAALEKGELSAVAGELGNVFEEVLAPEERQEIQSIKDVMLRGGALNAAMTGSGPTVFGIFEEAASAKQAEDVLKGQYIQVFQARPLKKICEGKE